MEIKTITEEEKALLILKDKLELVINKTEKPNSFETGKPGSRFKIYYSDIDDLKDQLQELVKAGLILEEDFKNASK